MAEGLKGLPKSSKLRIGANKKSIGKGPHDNFKNPRFCKGGSYKGLGGTGGRRGQGGKGGM